LPSRRRPSAGAFAAIVLTAVAVIPALVLAPPTVAASATAAVAYHLPFRIGESYSVNQGWHGPYSHFGRSSFAYDFGLPRDTPVVAAASGVVAYVQDGLTKCGGPDLLEAANYVVINHADGTATLYSHLSKAEAVVGQRVYAGQEIGRSGRTGYTDCAAHLHFARQAQGSAYTQSRPVYFVETGDRRLRMGQIVTSANAACFQTADDLPTDAFCGTYFSGTSPMPALTRVEAAIDFRWPVGGPTVTTTEAGNTVPEGPGDSIRPTAYSARWVGRFTFATAGTYTFSLTAARGVRLLVDGERLIDSSDEVGGLSDFVLIRTLPAGTHVIELDIRAVGPTVTHLGWFLSSDGAGSPILG
jgi:Peptidase family M23/PA14 domain